ncbi:MAG: efflux RND transporter periplasmic adaptor subunit [Bacteroidota bacterium]
MIAALLAAGCASKKKPRTPRVPVRVATAMETPMPYQLTSTGTVEAIRMANVAAQVTGVIKRVAFREGQFVRAGQVLFQLDTRPFRAALDQASAVLQRDRAQAENANADAQRSKTLYEQNVLSQSEWDVKRSTAEAATATVKGDEAAVRTARINLDFASIRAPIAGKTGRLLVHEGDLVRSGTNDALVTITQPQPIWVRFTVPDKDVPTVIRYKDAKPRVVVQPGDGSAPSEGKLVFVDSAVDATTGTLLLKGEFPNTDGRLVPGQFVDTRLILTVQPRALVVPSVAVSNGQQGTFVYRVQPDSTVAPQPVTVERTQDDLAVLSAGLSPGDLVVTDGQLRLSPGAKVVIRPAGREGGRGRGTPSMGGSPGAVTQRGAGGGSAVAGQASPAGQGTSSRAGSSTRSGGAAGSSR